MRRFSFKLPSQVQLERLETSDDVITFGQLRQAILASEGGHKFPFDDVAYIERNTKASYGQIMDAKLPAGNIIFYVTPTKTKSGAGINAKNILEFSYEDVETFLKERSHLGLIRFGEYVNEAHDADIDTDNCAADIKDEILQWHTNTREEEEYEENASVTEEAPVDGEAKDYLIRALILIEKAIQCIPGGATLDGTTLEELLEEAEAIRKEIQE